MTASLKWRSCSQAISCTMSTIQASPASEPEVPDEPMINGIPALMARVIMISVSRLTAAAENMQVPVASGPGPGSVLPASQPIIRAPSAIALSSDSARNPEPSMPVAETSGNDAIAALLNRLRGRGYREPRGAGTRAMGWRKEPLAGGAVSGFVPVQDDCRTECCDGQVDDRIAGAPC